VLVRKCSVSLQDGILLLGKRKASLYVVGALNDGCGELSKSFDQKGCPVYGKHGSIHLARFDSMISNRFLADLKTGISFKAAKAS